jgi:hypothetical protein
MRVVRSKEAHMAAITETSIQDVRAGDRILSPADGRIWVVDAVFQDNHGTYTLVLTRDDKGLHLYDHHLLGRHAILDVVR